MKIQGRVQGVGYRYFARKQAVFYGLDGFVKNNPDGSVDVTVEGMRETISEYIKTLQQGPRSAQVSDLIVEWSTARGDFRDFTIHI
ncbi:acylphosphatase [candidate division KSB1 bacterium]|nr:acylphosphatase [candidate division KSB1 bacterium]